MTTDSEQYYKILRQYWGYTEFRPLQLDIISSVGRGESSLALISVPEASKPLPSIRV